MTAAGDNYSVLYSNDKGLHIDDVRQTESGTAVSFRYVAQPYSRFSIASTAFLSDEQGIRHPVIKCEGIRMDSMQIVPDDGIARFTLMFTSLPTETDWFDFIEGFATRSWVIYGIHRSDLPPSFPVAAEMVDTSELQPAFFQPDSVVICGRFHNYSRLDMPHILGFRYERKNVKRSEQTYPNCAQVNADGSFCDGFLMDRPTWCWIEFWGYRGNPAARRMIPVYARPGDTIDVQIFDYGTWKERVEYTDSSGDSCLPGLMQLVWRWMPELKDFGQTENIGFAGLDALFSRTARQTDITLDYLINKHKLSPWESHLLKSEQRLILANDLLICRYDISKARYDCGLPDSLMNLPGDGFLSSILWNDSSLLITPSLNAGTSIWFKDRMVMAGLVENQHSERFLDDRGPFRPDDSHVQAFIDSIITKCPTPYVQLIFLESADSLVNQGMQRYSAIQRDNQYRSQITILGVICSTDDNGQICLPKNGGIPFISIPQEDFIKLRKAFRITHFPAYKTIKHDGTLLRNHINLIRFAGQD